MQLFTKKNKLDAGFMIGDLVVRQQRWHHLSQMIGLIISSDLSEESNQHLIMWTNKDNDIHFEWHLETSLIKIDEKSLNFLNKRKFTM